MSAAPRCYSYSCLSRFAKRADHSEKAQPRKPRQGRAQGEGEQADAAVINRKQRHEIREIAGFRQTGAPVVKHEPAAVDADGQHDLARGEGRVMGRSIAGQVEHWARLGRAVERAPGFAYERIHAALAAAGSIDDLTPDEQGVALAALEDYLEHLPRNRDASFFTKLRAAAFPLEDMTKLHAPEDVTDAFVDLAAADCAQHGEIVRV